MFITLVVVCNSNGQTQSNGLETIHRVDSEIIFNYSDGDSVKKEKQVYINDSAGNQLLYTSYEWDSGLNEWTLNTKTFYYYSTPTTAVKQLANQNIILYPNPTSSIINVSGLNYPVDPTIYNINGQLKKAFPQITNSVDISELTTGVYILRLISNNKTIVRKVVKE